MPRNWSLSLQEIHKSYRRRDTLVIYLADNSRLNLSRGEVIRDSTRYENSISSVEALRTSIDAGVDRVTVNCQNVDSLLGFNLASNLRLLDYAIAEYGKIYQSLINPTLIEDIPRFFRGVLANAEVDEKRISFELIVDYESLGTVIASRSLSPLSAWRTLNGIEVTATGTVSNPKTREDFIANGKEHEFGGWQFFEEPVASLPGSGGNEGGTGSGNECFTGRMKVATPDGALSFTELNERFKEGKKSIISPDRFTGELIEDEIEEMFISRQTGYFTLNFTDAELEVTKDHPLLADFGKLKPVNEFNRLFDTTKVFKDRWLDSKLLKMKWHSHKTVDFYCCKAKKTGMLLVNNCAVSNRSQMQIEF